jgi:hypothetical protein
VGGGVVGVGGGVVGVGEGVGDGEGVGEAVGEGDGEGDGDGDGVGEAVGVGVMVTTRTEAEAGSAGRPPTSATAKAARTASASPVSSPWVEMVNRNMLFLQYERVRIWLFRNCRGRG